MNADFRAYRILLKTNIKDMFFGTKTKIGFPGKREKKTEELSIDRPAVDKTKIKKFFSGILAAILSLVMVFYIVVFTFAIGGVFIKNGMEKEFLYSALLMVQLVVLFFGSASTLNLMYFGRDNNLVMSLPVKSSVVFAVKFTLAYLGELIISAALALPVLITFGVTCALSGGTVFGAQYYILSVLSVFLLPVLPLLLSSLISIALMYVVSFFKNRELGKNIVVTVLSSIVLIMYFVVIFGANAIEGTDADGNTVINSTGIAVFEGMSKAGIYNYNLVNAFVGNNTFLNFLIYLAGISAIFIVVLLTSSVFYRKGISVIAEGGGVSKKKTTPERKSFAKNSVSKAFIKKELRMFFGNPQILMGFVIVLVVLCVMGVVMTKTDAFIVIEEGETYTIADDIAFLGFFSYFASIFLVSANIFSSVGFSMEGKNFAVLKSMPVKPKDVLGGKVAVANITGAVIALAAAIIYVSTDRFHNPLIALLMFITLLFNGFASSAIGLYSDIKKPTFNFTNINQLTHNNKRLLKPMLINIAVSFSYLILGFVLAAVSKALGAVAVYAIFFAILILINGLFAFIAGKKLYGRIDELFERAEV